MEDDSRMLDDETVLQRMGRLNPWWKTGAVPAAWLKEFKRRDYSALAGRLDEPHAQSILGASRVGKTTMLYQMVADLIAGGTDPRRILFLSLDAQLLVPGAENLLRMLEAYANGVLGESIHDPAGRIYAILDEVHLARGWQRVVKNFFDQARPVKFVVSGSSWADALAGESEPLVGRIWRQALAAMSFAEYVSFKSPGHAGALSAAGSDMRACLDESVRTGSARPFYDSVKRASLGLAILRDDLEARLSDYMLHGGYPEIAARKGRPGRAEAIRTLTDLSLYRDAAGTGGVRNPAVLAQLFRSIAWRSPRTINVARTARDLGISKATLEYYCEALRGASLVSYAEFYTPSPAARRRKDRKAYVCDVGVRNAASMLGEGDTIDDPAEAGMMAETVAGDHTRRLWQALAPAAAPQMPRFWHSGGGSEANLVIKLHRKPVPIEVEYRRHVEPSRLRGLARFSAKFDPPVAIAVSRGETRLDGDRTVVVPMWLYLLMC